MRAFRVVVLLTLVSMSMAAADVHDVGYGTFEAPAEFSFQRTGTIDSFRGTLTRKGDGFKISFDIGLMAGTAMGEFRKHDCTFYRAHRINGTPAFTGIQRSGSGVKITTTIYDPAHVESPPAANFWADITSDSDIAEFLLVVSSYESRVKEPQ